MTIPLADVLDALRADLQQAQANKDPNNPLIIEEIEVELQTVVTRGIEGNGEAKGKVSLSVLDFLKLGEAEAKLSSKGKWDHAVTQKLKLKLSAGEKQPDGKVKKRSLSN